MDFKYYPDDGNWADGEVVITIPDDAVRTMFERVLSRINDDFSHSRIDELEMYSTKEHPNGYVRVVSSWNIYSRGCHMGREQETVEIPLEKLLLDDDGYYEWKNEYEKQKKEAEEQKKELARLEIERKKQAAQEQLERSQYQTFLELKKKYEGENQ